jgi:hypothetical protein
MHLLMLVRMLMLVQMIIHIKELLLSQLITVMLPQLIMQMDKIDS